MAIGKCELGHTDTEKMKAKLYIKPLRKVKRCTNEICCNNVKPSLCFYAHDDNDAFCPTCEKKGHFMENCRHRNSRFI